MQSEQCREFKSSASKLFHGIRGTTRSVLTKVDISDEAFIDAPWRIYKILNNQLTNCSGEEHAITFEPINDLETLKTKLDERLFDAFISATNYSRLTATQKIGLSAFLKYDCAGFIAPTGSGKTAAYVLPCINRILQDRQKGRRHQVIVLAPTKELVNQIYRFTTSVAKNLNLTTINLLKSKIDKAETADVIIGTVAAIEKLQGMKLKVKSIVIDEGDMLAEYNSTELYDIVKSQHKLKYLYLVSATLPGQAHNAVESVLKSAPIFIVNNKQVMPKNITQKVIYTDTEDQKRAALTSIYSGKQLLPLCIIFVQDIERCEQLTKYLSDKNWPVAKLHSELRPEVRQHTFDNFVAGNIWCLICTDLAARGLDCSGIRTVINFDLPLSTESYIQRVGRAGRLNIKANAYTFITFADMQRLRVFKGLFELNGVELPKNLPKMAPVVMKEMRNKAIQRKPFIYLTRKDKNDNYIRKARKKRSVLLIKNLTGNKISKKKKLIEKL